MAGWVPVPRVGAWLIDMHWREAAAQRREPGAFHGQGRLADADQIPFRGFPGTFSGVATPTP
jgi:hypothetical protein